MVQLLSTPPSKTPAAIAMIQQCPSFAYVTLLTRPSYLAGLLVLQQSLRAVHSMYNLVVMIPPTLPQETRDVLRRCRITVREIEWLHPPAGKYTPHQRDAHYIDTWTKLRAFELVEYEKIVLLDVDMLILKNMDELMDIDIPAHCIAATHVCACNPRRLDHYPIDWEPINCAHTSVKSPHSPPPLIQKDSPRPYHQLNSGTVVLRPSYALAEGLQAILLSQDLSQWKFPDQDLLAVYFKDRWLPLPWYYNALRSLRNTHPVMWSDREIRCLHYIFPEKPWHDRDLPTDLLSQTGFAMMNRWWWERFDPLVKRLRKTDSKSYYTLIKTMQRCK